MPADPSSSSDPCAGDEEPLGDGRPGAVCNGAAEAVVDQATGLLMGVYGLDADEARDVLVWIARQNTIGLDGIAERFLRIARVTDVGAPVQDHLTQLLAELARGTPAPDLVRTSPTGRR